LGINSRYLNYPNYPNNLVSHSPMFGRTALDPAPRRLARTTSYSTRCSCECPDFTHSNSNSRIGGCALNGISVNSLMCPRCANANCVCTDVPLCPVRASANANCVCTNVPLCPARALMCSFFVWQMLIVSSVAVSNK
jgi:hypothetical protein